MRDAIIVGSGPNGLAAGITLAKAGRSVLMVEEKQEIGGGARSAELTLPGFTHDVCSGVFPMALASPFFKSLNLENWGLRWIHPEVPLAHPFDGGKTVSLFRSVRKTSEGFGNDCAAYSKMMDRWVPSAEKLFKDLLAPLHIPDYPFLMASFGLKAVQSAEHLAKRSFREETTRGLLAGLATHSFLPLGQRPSAAIALVLAVAGHSQGWPIAAGGARSISIALASYFKHLGGEIAVGCPVKALADLPPARDVFFDLSVCQLKKLLGTKLPPHYRKQLDAWHSGPGTFKLDFALSGPIPWKNSEIANAGTVHLGGTLEEIAFSEKQVADGAVSDYPFVILSQPSQFDPTRAPAGKHTAWAYCHVPRGSGRDMTERITNQIERFAPGFRSVVLATHSMGPSGFERHNSNLVGGDISGGIANLKQLFFRPVVKFSPYALPIKNWYLCSSSTPPGAGVHGMCGYFAARAALRKKIIE